MTELFEDLRMFIGGFFLIVGAILIFESTQQTAASDSMNLDLWSGCAFIAFSLLAMAAAVLAQPPKGA